MTVIVTDWTLQNTYTSTSLFDPLKQDKKFKKERSVNLSYNAQTKQKNKVSEKVSQIFLTLD